jgi:tetratricopeptide (TPR) repeat protein
MQRPVDQAAFLSDIGQALVSLGNMRSSVVEPQQAIETYQQAIALYREGGQPGEADRVRKSLATAQVELGYQLSKTGDYARAVEAYRASLDNRDRTQDPQDWLFSANQLAVALHNLGTDEQGVETLRLAADAYRTAPRRHLGG